MDMNRLNVKGLKSLAKVRGFKEYSQLGRAELIKLLNRSILDDKVPEINVPILRPVPHMQSNKVTSLKSLVDGAADQIKRKINEIAD